MKKFRLIILGAGGYGRTIGDIAFQLGKYDEIKYLDDNAKADDIIDTCVNFVLYIDDKTEFYPAIGNNIRRIELLNSLMSVGCNIATIIHPTAYVSPTAKIMPGCTMLPKAVVNTSCTLKMGCIVNCGAIVDHGCVLEEGVHVCLGAIVKAENQIPRATKIEAGEIIENRKFPLKGEYQWL